MPIFIFNKLVRNNIVQACMDDPKVIETKYRVLDDEEYAQELIRKISEEADEIPKVITNDNRKEVISEIADLQEVIDDLKVHFSLSDTEIEAAAQNKRESKGGFKQRYYIDYVNLADDSEWNDVFRLQPHKYPELSHSNMKNVGDVPELKLGMYKHYKGGMYEVLRLACHTETLEWYVVYESQQRKLENLPSVWIRPYNMFIEQVEIDGSIKPRFEKVD